jgi:hypothetical protein
MPVVSQIDVANLALARIRASQITSIAENTLEGREVRRFYPRAIADCLAGPFDHDWSFANYRTTLAQLVVNDRASEWLFAYAVPSNMASPIRVLPDFNGLGLGLPIPLLGDPYAESWMAQGGYFETPYIIEGQTIYTNTENAVSARRSSPRWSLISVPGWPSRSRATASARPNLARRPAMRGRSRSPRTATVIPSVQAATSRKA